MRGRKPVPTAIKILRGNPGRRPLPTSEPMPAALEETHAPPAWLHETAKREWRRLAPVLARAGLLTALDVDALTSYCVQYSLWRQAVAVLRRKGVIQVDKETGIARQSPYLLIARQTQASLTKLLVEFGMTPSARARVTRAAPGHDPSAPATNPLDEFLRR